MFEVAELGDDVVATAVTVSGLLSASVGCGVSLSPELLAAPATRASAWRSLLLDPKKPGGGGKSETYF